MRATWGKGLRRLHLAFDPTHTGAVSFLIRTGLAHLPSEPDFLARALCNTTEMTKRTKAPRRLWPTTAGRTGWKTASGATVETPVTTTRSGAAIPGCAPSGDLPGRVRIDLGFTNPEAQPACDLSSSGDPPSWGRDRGARPVHHRAAWDRRQDSAPHSSRSLLGMPCAGRGRGARPR